MPFSRESVGDSEEKMRPASIDKQVSINGDVDVFKGAYIAEDSPVKKLT